MRAIVVDDSNLNLKVETKQMEKLGFTTDSVLSGEECLNKVKDNNYDVIIMDIMMPIMDGIETLNNLKKIENFNTPVVALTADVANDAKERYLSLGFASYISKPATIDVIKKHLELIGFKIN